MRPGSTVIAHPGLPGFRARMGVGRPFLFGFGMGDVAPSMKDVRIESVSYRYTEWKNDVPDTKITGISLKSQESKTGYALGSTVLFDEQKVYTGSGKGHGGGFRGWITVTLAPLVVTPVVTPADQGIPAGYTSWGLYSQALSSAVSSLRNFDSQLQAGGISPDSAVPSAAGSVGSPGVVGVPDNVSALWSEYQAILANIPSSRGIGRIMWESRQQSSTPPTPSSGGSGSGTGVDSQGYGNDRGGGYAYPGQGGPYDTAYYSPTYSNATVVPAPQGMPVGSTTVFSDVGQNPFLPQPQATPSQRRFAVSPKKAAIGGAGVLVVGGLVFFFVRRRKKKKKKASAGSFPYGA